MIRRLIILLLIVGCDKDEPKGACVFLVGVDSITAIAFLDTTFSVDDLMHFQCEDNYTLDNCCSSGIYPECPEPQTMLQSGCVHSDEDSNRNIKFCSNSAFAKFGFLSGDVLYPDPTLWIGNEVCIDSVYQMFQELTYEDTTMSLYDSLMYNVNTEFDTSIIAFDSLIIGAWELNQVRILGTDNNEWNLSTYPNNNTEGYVQQSNRTFFIDGTTTNITSNESHTDTMQFNWLTNQNQQLILLRNDNTTYANFNYYYIDNSENLYLVLIYYGNFIMEEKLKLITNPL